MVRVVGGRSDGDGPRRAGVDVGEVVSESLELVGRESRLVQDGRVVGGLEGRADESVKHHSSGKGQAHL